MKKWAPILLILAIASPFANAQRPVAEGSQYVNAEMFGDTWPLTVSEGTLHCYFSGAVVIAVVGRGTFTLNGWAMTMMDARPSLGWRDLPQVLWADDRPGWKKILGPLIDAGLDLCQ